MRKKNNIQYSNIGYITIIIFFIYKIYKEYNPDNQISLSYNQNKEKYGNITWGYLHTLSISYPFSPSDENKKNMKNILFAVANLYPCRKCGNHWKNILNYDNQKSNQNDSLIT